MKKIYFPIPLEAEEENPVETVNKGDLAFWPSGSAFCIFFGPTPMSIGDEIRPASAVNIIGRIPGDISGLKEHNSGDTVEIERAT
ncbi:MAG: cyclophilin-like family protein [Elusimicrobiota bacterium]